MRNENDKARICLFYDHFGFFFVNYTNSSHKTEVHADGNFEVPNIFKSLNWIKSYNINHI